jgi:tol-pal system protein YbgF
MTIAAVAGAGCASQLSIVKAENARLRTQVTQLRADKRRAERKSRELENELALSADRADTAAIGAARTGAPVLPVEVLAPEPAPEPTSDLGLGNGARVVAIGEDGTEIVYEGDAASGKAASWSDDDLDSDAPDPPRRAAAPAPAPRPRVTDDDRIPSATASTARASERSGAAAAEQYRAAVDQLRAGHHDDAIAQLRDFVKHHPSHDYADNAQYWLGEAFYDRKDYGKALAEFRAAVDKYPRGNKVPDALLKVGYCYLALGQADKGRFALEQVTTIYPKTEPAVLAAKRLETIGP